MRNSLLHGGAIPHDVKEIFSREKGFEDGMNELWQNHHEISPLLLQQFGIYFSRLRPADTSGTLYTQLVNRLVGQRAEGVMLSTLNYDCLLDGEITRIGRKVNYLFPLKEGDAPEGLLLLKLHGSCNWLPDMPMGRNVRYTSTVRLDCPVYSVNNEEALSSYLTDDTSLYPVMRIYTKEKPAQLCPTFFEHLTKEWSNTILQAKKIVLIGIRPYPPDSHIWSPLEKSPAKIFCIGNQVDYENWQVQSGRTGELHFIDDRFTEDSLRRLWTDLF